MLAINGFAGGSNNEQDGMIGTWNNVLKDCVCKLTDSLDAMLIDRYEAYENGA
ncbi:MAG TPA: hypothetical protein VEY10_06290 [Flavisolibacter sp.]|nr:hypothetical protein [Flavisolibacter sp.]